MVTFGGLYKNIYDSVSYKTAAQTDEWPEWKLKVIIKHTDFRDVAFALELCVHMHGFIPLRILILVHV